jgi:hypothetical protein
MSDRVAVMSNRPGRIVEYSDHPRPRTYEMMGTAPFIIFTAGSARRIRAESAPLPPWATRRLGRYGSPGICRM